MSDYLSETKNGPRAPAALTTQVAWQRGPWSTRSDEQLVLEYARTENRQAFEELVHRFEREMYSYLRSRLSDAHLAEDAFQATFLQLHLKCRQFEPSRRLRPWLFTIANNQAIDLMRRNRRHKVASLCTTPRHSGSSGQCQSLGDSLEAADAGPSQRLEAAEDRQRTRSAVETMSAKLRQVLELVVFQGLAHSEAADRLGIPLGTVKSRMNAALQRLRRALDPLAGRPALSASLLTIGNIKQP
jgi:RNA polymerase sigma-70 factor (ECF subfamily)